MILIFEDSGKLQAGREFSRAETSLQVETASGKRSKIKMQQILLELKTVAIPVLTDAALQAQVADIDLDLAWEFAPDGDFSASELAQDYFGAQVSDDEQIALLLALVAAPHYFRRANKNRFKKATAEVLQQALAAIEKKQRIAAEIAAWSASLQAGQCPEPIAGKLYPILFKPDKNSPEYKAVADAAVAAKLSPIELLQRAGALRGDAAGAYDFHWQRFLFSHFPKGIDFAALDLPPLDVSDLPIAEGVAAFSIDDSSTTEIDDALSVQHLDRALVIVGIHIAAPALGIQPGSAWDEIAAQRQSTVYMPGQKITMLPQQLVADYTLGAGQLRPALSLYLHIDQESLEILDAQTKLERLPVAANLHLETLEPIASSDWLTQGGPERAAVLSALGIDAALQLPEKLSFLYRLARHWKAQRELARGKPENFSRPDYSFKLLRGEECVQGAVTGTESVQISQRQRGEPLDLIVAECAIAANSTWGQWLGSLGVPMIYRSQAALAPGFKVRMGVKPQRHAGMGVAAYAWSTSPLRRYVDLVNQRQLIAAVQYGATAALQAPFKPKDAQLFAVISAFDAAYSAYNAYQGQMERYWTLRHLQMAGIKQLTGSIFKDEGWLRADDLPLTLQVFGAEDLPRGSRLKVQLGEIDLLSLHLHATVLEHWQDADHTASLEDDSEDEDTSQLEVGPSAEAMQDATAEAETAKADLPKAGN